MSECEEPPRSSAYGGVSTGYDQEQSGNKFPFVLTNPALNLAGVIADLWFCFRDDCVYSYPFSIRWLAGFGCDGTLPEGFSHPHAYDLCLVDADDQVIFDTRTAVFIEEDWGEYLKILEWTAGDSVLRVNKYTKTTKYTPPEIGVYFEPQEYGQLDPFSIEPTKQSLRGFRVESGSGFRNLILENGYNTTITPVLDIFQAAQPGEFTLAAEAGTGLGQVPADCDSVDLFVATINGVTPVNGRINLIAKDCYRTGRPLLNELQAGTETEPREIAVLGSHLLLGNDCAPCGDCNEYINTYEGLRRIRNKMAETRLLYDEARESLARSIARFNSQKRCREGVILQIQSTQLCPCSVGYSLAFCNQTEECITDVVIMLSFDHVEGGEAPPGGYIVPNSVMRGNFSDPTLRRSVARQSYRLGGTYPYYWAHFPAIDPKQQAYVQFLIALSSCESATVVNLTAEAFQLETYSPEAVPPVPGYVFGEGYVMLFEGVSELAGPVVNTITNLLTECETY